MSTEAIGAYSPTTVYGQLTSPFTPNNIKINSHTPYDKTDESEQSKATSRENFLEKSKHIAKMKYELPKIKDDKGSNKTNKGITIGTEEEDKAPVAQVDITTFQASKISDKDLVHNSLKQGYSTGEAIHIKNAQKAYKNSSFTTKEPVQYLSTREYKVS